VAVEVRERLSLNKLETLKFDIERFDLKKLNYVEVNKKISG
jgi:uncharacterized protein (DUF2225 family)